MYSVDIADQAEADIADAYEWLFEKSPSAADRWAIGLIAAIESLAISPNRCPVAVETRYFAKESLRLLIYGRYRILFVVRGNGVIVLHVRHGSRDYAQKEDFGIPG